MPSFLELAWLIPFSPLLGSILVWILLISFNRTLNRLTKPVSYLLIACVGLSTALSFLLLEKNLFGQILDLNLNISKLNFHLGLSIDKLASIASLVFGVIVLIIMICSYFLMDRQRGYVRYFIFLGLISGSVFSFILSGELFHRYF